MQVQIGVTLPFKAAHQELMSFFFSGEESRFSRSQSLFLPPLSMEARTQQTSAEAQTGLLLRSGSAEPPRGSCGLASSPAWYF